MSRLDVMDPDDTILVRHSAWPYDNYSVLTLEAVPLA